MLAGWQIAASFLRENNQAGGFTHTWTYDNAGNILNRKEYSYTTGDLGDPDDTVTYAYGNADWGDLLTEYDGTAITYDEIGNPLTYGGRTYTWRHGRQLATLTENGTTWTNTYDADGMRVSRVSGTVAYSYIYSGSKLRQMTMGTDVLTFTYDAAGTPMSLCYNGTDYYYATNLQGDVVGILDSTGQQVVAYSYAAWGNILSTTGPMAVTLGTHNPLRYRGYVYDPETALYYLQSRYYDPQIGRWLNADGLVSTGQGFTGNNMFAYCGNNPVKNIDPSGTCYYGANGKWCHDNWEYIGGYERKPDPGYYQGTTYQSTDPSGLDVYVAPNDNYSTPPNAVKVIDARNAVDSNGAPNPDIQVRNSYKYTNRIDQAGILALIGKYDVLNPSLNKWNRTQNSLFIEWDLHNFLYSVSKVDNFKHADFDQNDEHLTINFFKRLLKLS